MCFPMCKRGRLPFLRTVLKRYLVLGIIGLMLVGFTLAGCQTGGAGSNGETGDGWFDSPGRQENYDDRSLMEEIGPDASPVDGF